MSSFGLFAFLIFFMKTYILFIFAFLFLASCGSKDSNTITFAGKSTQTVTGS